MTLRCTRCGAEGDGDKVDIYSRNSFTHKRGCGSGIGPLKVIEGTIKQKVDPQAEPELVGDPEPVVKKSKKKKSKKKSD